MNPTKVIVESTAACVGYFCSQCNRLHTTAVYACTDEHAANAALQSATSCCVCQNCECGKPVERHYTKCSACRDEAQRAKDQKLWDNAKKIPLSEYTEDMAYRDGFGNEGYFFVTDPEEDDEGNEIEWAWGCYPIDVTASDCALEDFVNETILQDHHESSSEKVDWEKVRQAEALLLEACKDIKSYMEDNSVVVVFHEPKAEE